MTADEIRSEREKCEDCGGQLHEIKLLENKNGAPAPLAYASGDAKNNWTGFYPVQGTVLTFRCSSCARLSLYGADIVEKKSGPR